MTAKACSWWQLVVETCTASAALPALCKTVLALLLQSSKPGHDSEHGLHACLQVVLFAVMHDPSIKYVRALHLLGCAIARLGRQYLLHHASLPPSLQDTPCMHAAVVNNCSEL